MELRGVINAVINFGASNMIVEGDVSSVLVYQSGGKRRCYRKTIRCKRR